MLTDRKRDLLPRHAVDVPERQDYAHLAVLDAVDVTVQAVEFVETFFQV